MKGKKSIKGFTLIEIMLVVAIVGILAAIAYPSYMETVRRSNRADAKVELNDVAQQLQRCFTAYSAYNNTGCGVYKLLTEGGKEIISDEEFYVITASEITATSFTLSAAPATEKMQATDLKCTGFTLTHSGVKEATGSDKEHCW